MFIFFETHSGDRLLVDRDGNPIFRNLPNGGLHGPDIKGSRWLSGSYNKDTGSQAHAVGAGVSEPQTIERLEQLVQQDMMQANGEQDELALRRSQQRQYQNEQQQRIANSRVSGGRIDGGSHKKPKGGARRTGGDDGEERNKFVDQSTKKPVAPKHPPAESEEFIPDAVGPPMIEYDANEGNSGE